MRLNVSDKMAFEAVAIIVAGGLGTRAREMTGDDLPKALMPVAGVPIIERQILALVEQGFSKIVILAGHLGHLIQAFVSAKLILENVEIIVHIESSALGTAGAVISAKHLYDAYEQLVIVFGDLLFDLDFSNLLSKQKESKAAAAIVCRPNDHPKESDVVQIDDDSFITNLLSKKNRTAGEYRNLVPTGIYSVSRSEIDAYQTNEKLDFFQDLFPALLKQGKRLVAVTTAPYICDVGTVSGRNAAEQDLASGRVQRMHTGILRPTVFFDVDGVLNEEIPGVGITSASEVRMIPGAGAALRRLNEIGVLAVGITNRPQLAKGQVTREGLEQIFSRLEMRLAEEKGYLDKIYFCPHHPEAGHEGEITALKVRCNCRKPDIGLLTRAMQELPVDPKHSSMIGDSWRDISVAKKKGIYAYGVRTGFGCRELPIDVRPDLMFDSVSDSVIFCLNYKNIAESVLKHVDLNRLNKGRLLIGIAGASQSGKSCVAHAIERYCKDQGLPALRVTLDDWILPINKRFGAKVYERTQAASFGSIYKALKNGQTVSTERYDPFTRGSGPVISYTAPENALIIIDGVLACSVPGLDELDLSVFIDIPEEIASHRQRCLLKWKNLSDGQIEMLMKERQGDELSTVLLQKSNADVILNYESFKI